MKTLKLKLKKDVLIVDENDFDYYELFKDGIYLKLANGDRDYIEGNFELICKGSELTEEIASDIFEHDDFLNRFEAYIDTVPSIDKSALKLFIKIFESKGFFWLENPMSPYIPVIDKKADENYMKKYFEAEEKTFRNPLIFLKK